MLKGGELAWEGPQGLRGMDGGRDGESPVVEAANRPPGQVDTKRAPVAYNPVPNPTRWRRKSWVDAFDDEQELVPLAARSAGSTVPIKTSLPPPPAVGLGTARGEASVEANAGLIGRTRSQLSRLPSSSNDVIPFNGTASEVGTSRVNGRPVDVNQLKRGGSAGDDEMSRARALVGRDWVGDSQPKDSVGLVRTTDALEEDKRPSYLKVLMVFWDVAWWKNKFLIFEDPKMEVRFEEAWAHPDRLTLPLMLYSAMWSLTYVQHKTIDSWFGNKLQIALALAVLIVPLLTILGCYNRRATRFLRRWYHTTIIVNVCTPLAFPASPAPLPTCF